MNGKPALVAIALTGIAAVVALEVLVALGRFRPYALLAGGVVATVVLGLLWLVMLIGVPRPASTPPDDSSDDALVRWQARTRLLITWADGSRGEWDRHLRPILAREFLMATGKRSGTSGAGRAGSAEATGAMTFGPELWAWVDPSGADYDRRDQAGPGRAALDDILARLEQL